MSSIRIPVPSEHLAAHLLSDMPDEARKTFQRGYSVLAKLSAEKQQKVLSASLQALEGHGVPMASKELQQELGLDEPEAEMVVGAAMLLASGVAAQASRKVAEDVLAEIAKAQLIEAEDMPRIEPLYSSLKSRAHELESRVERSQLASQILPAFRWTRTVVDVRVESGEKRLAVVVGLVHIHTDSRDDSLDFQVTPHLLDSLIKDLEELRREMNEAEKMVGVWEKK